MLKKGSLILSIWCFINFILALIILCYVIILKQNSPILQVASFSDAEIAGLSARTIAALNCFTILYNSCSHSTSDCPSQCNLNISTGISHSNCLEDDSITFYSIAKDLRQQIIYIQKTDILIFLYPYVNANGKVGA